MSLILGGLVSQYKKLSGSRSSMRRVLTLLLFAFLAINMLIAYSSLSFGDVMAAGPPPEKVRLDTSKPDSLDEPFAVPIPHVFIENDRAVSFKNVKVYPEMVTLGSRGVDILSRFAESNDAYVADYLRPLLHEDDYIDPSQIHSDTVAVWLEDHGVTVAVTRVSLVTSSEQKDAKTQSSPKLLFLYAEALNVEGAVLKKYSLGGITYPAFLPIEFFTEELNKIQLGPISHKVLVVKGESGLTEPLLVYTSSLGKDTIDTFISPLRLFSESEKASSLNFLQSAKAVVKGKEKEKQKTNWIPFVENVSSSDEIVHDTSILFITDIIEMRIAKCNILSGECESTSNSKSYANLGKHQILAGTALVDISNFLPQLESHESIYPEEVKNAWIGFINYRLENCGCGDVMVRPGLILMVKTNDKKMRIIQLSSALDFELDVPGWEGSASNDRCESQNSFAATSIIKWKSTLNEDDASFDDILSLGITLGSSESFTLPIRGLLNASVNALSRVKSGKLKGSDFTSAIQRSALYCKAYGEKHSPKENEHQSNDDTKSGQEDSTRTILTLYPTYIEDPVEHFTREFPTDDKRRKFVQLAVDVDSEMVFRDHKYKDYLAIMYDAFTPFAEDSTLKQCEAIQSTFKFQVSETINKDMPLHDLIRKYLRKDKSLTHSQLLYFEEFVPLLKDKVKKLLEDDEFLQTRWFRFAGSAVYLKEYGVNIMLSRVSFAHLGIRNRLAFSLTYVQLYDSKWEELVDVDLVVPSTDDPTRKFKIVRYPDFLRVPSYNPESGQFYGPEDPRLVLRINPLGYEEPIVIFNQAQRSITGFEGDDGKNVKLSQKRRLYLCFPWEYQLGKTHIDPISFEKKLVAYNRVAELTIYDENGKPLGRRDKEKNWTPFVMPTERKQSGGFDKYLYFVYQWDFMTVLRCTIPTTIDHEAKCEFIYQNLPARQIGELRGGTQLLSVNELLKDVESDYPPLTQEYWFGIGRSRVKKCGCGGTIYRPQFLLVTKDNEEMKFQVTHLTSFMTLDLEILPYDEMQPNVYCGGVGPSIILPNGIGQWVAKEDNGDIDDVITFFFSNGDRTVDLLYIRGVLKELFRLNAFRRAPQKEEMLELMPEIKDKSEKEKYEIDFFKSHAHVTCANKQSREYCRIFGEAHPDKGSNRQ